MLYYVLDPMCSWCWGFAPAFDALLERLPPEEGVRYVMGGLAPDSDRPMPQETREYVQEQWRLVAERTGATFNWEFWQRCHPRRSTWIACRAVIAAGLQGDSLVPAMIRAIQEAYYLQARNPSERETLIELAGEIGLDTARFVRDLGSGEVERRFQADLELRHRLGVKHFPTVLLEREGHLHLLADGYTDPATLLQRYGEIAHHGGTE